MNAIKTLVVAISCLSIQAALADDASPPKATATRPAKETTGQSSLPNTAPPATATQPTATTNQDATIKKMNDDEKRKIEREGK
jgi:hypothetical protein